jgi:DNA-binding transcriptional LysR family regulator
MPGLSETIRRFRQREEAVELVLSMLPPGTLEEALINGEIHLGIGYFWHRAPSLQYLPLFTEHQIAYCSQEHPLFLQAGNMPVEEAARHDWAWRSYPLPDIPLPVENWRITARADNMEAMAVLILSGHHLGFCRSTSPAPWWSRACCGRSIRRSCATTPPFTW